MACHKIRVTFNKEEIRAAAVKLAEESLKNVPHIPKDNIAFKHVAGLGDEVTVRVSQAAILSALQDKALDAVHRPQGRVICRFENTEDNLQVVVEADFPITK